MLKTRIEEVRGVFNVLQEAFILKTCFTKDFAYLKRVMKESERFL